MILSFLFFIIAVLYSMVGFGGGSSYTAILSTFETPYELIPKISLFCNIIVVLGGCWHYFKNNLIDWKLTIPLVACSVPFAYLGGVFRISQKMFFLILSISLILVGLRLLVIKVKDHHQIKIPKLPLLTVLGSSLGFLAGLVGIGGGIFLSPLLINFGWAKSKQAAATASVFILVNSISGLIGQFIKGSQFAALESHYLWLIPAVFLGGQIGSRLSAHPKVSYRAIQLGTGILTLFIGVKVAYQLL
jgi:uncharacterized membrane protein YfcA